MEFLDPGFSLPRFGCCSHLESDQEIEDSVSLLLSKGEKEGGREGRKEGKRKEGRRRQANESDMARNTTQDNRAPGNYRATLVLQILIQIVKSPTYGHTQRCF